MHAFCCKQYAPNITHLTEACTEPVCLQQKRRQQHRQAQIGRKLHQMRMGPRRLQGHLLASKPLRQVPRPPSIEGIS